VESGEAKKHGKAEKLKSREAGNQKLKAKRKKKHQKNSPSIMCVYYIYTYCIISLFYIYVQNLLIAPTDIGI
jgi:hypothetical protein